MNKIVKASSKDYKNNRPDDPASVLHDHTGSCIMSCNGKYRSSDPKSDHDLSAVYDLS